MEGYLPHSAAGMVFLQMSLQVSKDLSALTI